MAKKIPVKKKPREKFSDKRIKQVIADYDLETDGRYAYARALMANQPDDTRELVVGMVVKMQEMAGKPTLTLRDGGETLKINIPDMIQERNFYFYAVKMLLACAQMDIQLGGFVAPKACVECGVKVK